MYMLEFSWYIRAGHSIWAFYSGYKAAYNMEQVCFCSLYCEILIYSLLKIPYWFSDYLCLKTLDVHNCETMENMLTLMIDESQCNFANVSAMKARIFMKFKSEAHKMKKLPKTEQTHIYAVCAQMFIISFVVVHLIYAHGWYHICLKFCVKYLYV